MIVSWCSKKQRTGSTSTTKAIYIALRHTARKSAWIRWFLNKLKVKVLIGACLLHENNDTSIIFINNVETQTRIKHIDVQYYYIHKLVANKEVEIEWIYSASMLTDGFTKALNADSFKCHQDLLGLTSWNKWINLSSGLEIWEEIQES